MIERFNFYDVYGYLLPGAAVLMVLCSPFLLTAEFVLSIELSSALVGSVLAYFLGHLLQLLSRETFPSKKWAPENPVDRALRLADARGPSDRELSLYRFHSAVMLDSGDESFDKDFKRKLAAAIRTRLNLATDSDVQRNVAFEACRQHLQADNVPSYAEQFQGLYALMRGLCSASVLGVALAAGWAIGAATSELERVLFAIAVTVTTMVLSFLLWKPASGWCFWGVAAMAAANGGILGSLYSVEPNAPLRMATAAVGFAVAARYFHKGNRFYTGHFARSVYLAFYAKTANEAARPRIPRHA